MLPSGGNDAIAIATFGLNTGALSADGCKLCEEGVDGVLGVGSTAAACAACAACTVVTGMGMPITGSPGGAWGVGGVATQEPCWICARCRRGEADGAGAGPTLCAKTGTCDLDLGGVGVATGSINGVDGAGGVGDNRIDDCINVLGGGSATGS